MGDDNDNDGTMDRREEAFSFEGKGVALLSSSKLLTAQRLNRNSSLSLWIEELVIHDPISRFAELGRC